MELWLVEYFADEFNKQVGNGVGERKYPKAMAKLKKQVKLIKEILSANTAAPISVESLYDDLDFSYIFKSFNHSKDFEVSLAYDREDLLPPGISSPVFAHYSARNLSSPIKTNLHFSLSRSGILSLDQAEAVIQISEWIEVPKRNLTVENLTSPNISVDIVKKTMGPGMSLSKESFSEAKRKLEALDKKDAERRKTAELKNNLEEYIYATKEKLETSEDFEKISSTDERQSVIKKLDEVQEWLYTDGEDATATEFQKRLNLLKATANPIFFRFKELTARPEAVEVVRRYLTELQQRQDDREIETEIGRKVEESENQRRKGRRIEKECGRN
ncbi:hypothetical protein CRYUN_Cryun09bG0140900 [Craigia yunnanensis]